MGRCVVIRGTYGWVWRDKEEVWGDGSNDVMKGD